MDTTAGISRSCVLVSLSFSHWTGRKKDKSVTKEVIANKNANSARAGSFNKYLLADCKELDAIGKFISLARKKHLKLTLPWQDGGARLLPVKQLQTYQTWVDEVEQEFRNLVTNFLTRYDVLVTSAAFAIGDMFDRDEYPEVDTLKNKFGMDLVYDPVPLQGDFRVDIDTETKNDLVTQHEQKIARRIEEAQRDMFDRTKVMLERMVERLTVEDGQKNKIFRDTFIDNAEELCDLLSTLNPTGNIHLINIESGLRDAIRGIDPKSLRDSDVLRATTKDRIATILDAYDW